MDAQRMEPTGHWWKRKEELNRNRYRDGDRDRRVGAKTPDGTTPTRPWSHTSTRHLPLIGGARKVWGLDTTMKVGLIRIRIRVSNWIRNRDPDRDRGVTRGCPPLSNTVETANGTDVFVRRLTVVERRI